MASERAGFRWLGPSERAEVVDRLGAGEDRVRVALALGCSVRTVERIWVESKVKSRRVGESEHRLGFAERERISRGLAAGESFRALGRELGRAASTVSREVGGCGGRRGYRALAAHRRALGMAARPKPGKLSASPRLRAAVEAGLGRRWSPQQIAARLRAAHPDDQEMRISHETIYQSLYIQSRGELRRQLTANLRSGRTRRRPRAAGLGSAAGSRAWSRSPSARPRSQTGPSPATGRAICSSAPTGAPLSHPGRAPNPLRAAGPARL